MSLEETFKQSLKEFHQSGGSLIRKTTEKPRIISVSTALSEGVNPGEVVALHTRLEHPGKEGPKYTYKNGTIFTNTAARHMIPLKNVAHMSGTGSSITFKLPGKFVPVTIKHLKNRKQVEEFLTAEISHLRS